MAETPIIDVDVVIIGGGAAGLWLLDELRRRRIASLLLESSHLGSGQTVASQGIIHGGLKYSLAGFLSASARTIRDMPIRWQRCLAGEAQPDLRSVRVRSHYCFLWQTKSVRSMFTMFGAIRGLRIKPRKLAPDERPPPLRQASGSVYRLDEQVIEPGSFISVLADRNREHILQIHATSGLELLARSPGHVELIQLINPESGESTDLRPGVVVLCAGEGNESIRDRLKLPPHAMQRRPLHMVMARGQLPELYGHCIDGRKTRLTITSTRDYAERVVWQIGGQPAEDGVQLSPTELVLHAFREVRSTLPSVNLAAAQWATYRVNRAEPASLGLRPAGTHAHREGNTITAWPTKLALVPALADEIIRIALPEVKYASTKTPHRHPAIINWPRPNVALPPWETQEQWITEV